MIWDKFLNKKNKFLISNILKGFLAFSIFVFFLFLLRNNYSEADRLAWVGPIYDKPKWIMAFFVGSEILFGIIPPEIFMLWSLQTSYLGPYFLSIGFLSLISYGAGFLNFMLGRFLKSKIEWLNSRSKFISKYRNLFAEKGGQLVIVAAISPLPFSAISLLSGAGGLSKRVYLVNSLFRFARFFVYAYFLLKIES
jgi:hypothetical protein